MIYGYARVSTAAQSRDGNSLEEQVAALQKYGCHQIVEEAFTGKTMERPKIQKLLEILEEDWKALLLQGEAAVSKEENESLLERIAVYFAFRYLLKCVNDGDLLSRAQFCVLAVLVIDRLAAVCGLSEALRRFSCELEHSDVNLETLQDMLFRGDELSLRQFLACLEE